MSEFHPDRHLPDCMMPDGGECCSGHAAVCDDWHKQRSQLTAAHARIAALEGALEEVRGCFDAACFEGLHDRMNEVGVREPGSLTDLVRRRLWPAYEAAIVALRPAVSGADQREKQP